MTWYLAWLLWMQSSVNFEERSLGWGVWSSGYGRLKLWMRFFGALGTSLRVQLVIDSRPAGSDVPVVSDRAGRQIRSGDKVADVSAGW